MERFVPLLNLSYSVSSRRSTPCVHLPQNVSSREHSPSTVPTLGTSSNPPFATATATAMPTTQAYRVALRHLLAWVRCGQCVTTGPRLRRAPRKGIHRGAETHRAYIQECLKALKADDEEAYMELIHTAKDTSIRRTHASTRFLGQPSHSRMKGLLLLPSHHSRAERVPPAKQHLTCTSQQE